MISPESNALAMINAIVKMTGKTAPANAKILTILFISVWVNKLDRSPLIRLADSRFLITPHPKEAEGGVKPLPYTLICVKG